MFATAPPSPFQGEEWGFDNGAFDAYSHNKPFDTDRFLRRLEVAQQCGTPLVAVTPDIVAAGTRSLEFSWEWMASKLLPADWPWYLAVQDGMTRRNVEDYIRGGWAGLFLGGTNRFKQQTAWQWCELAHEFGLKFHYGRAGTLRKLDHAKRIGADSLDSTFPLWTKERLAVFIEHFHDDRQQPLSIVAA